MHLPRHLQTSEVKHTVRQKLPRRKWDAESWLQLALPSVKHTWVRWATGPQLRHWCQTARRPDGGMAHGAVGHSEPGTAHLAPTVTNFEGILWVSSRACYHVCCFHGVLRPTALCVPFRSGHFFVALRTDITCLPSRKGNTLRINVAWMPVTPGPRVWIHELELSMLRNWSVQEWCVPLNKGWMGDAVGKALCSA